MARDFTVKTYLELLSSIKEAGYDFLPYKDFYARVDLSRTITLRHDVDARKENSLAFARIQHSMQIAGTYYFRVVPGSYDEKIMREIYSLGHEVGYHYETMDTSKGDIDAAYDEFCFYLEKFRKIVPVTTICMHGSPLSKFDNRSIWKKYDYRKLGLAAEPYFDLDFNNTFYLTDTGRRWDGARVSVRDKAMDKASCTNVDFLSRNYHATADIIKDLKKNQFPSRVMMTFHPQRWSDDLLQWWQELLIQNLKNQVKRVLVSR